MLDIIVPLVNTKQPKSEKKQKIYGLIDVYNRLVHTFDSFAMRNIDQ